jgi:hypothetical protein
MVFAVQRCVPLTTHGKIDLECWGEGVAAQTYYFATLEIVSGFKQGKANL